DYFCSSYAGTNAWVF
nr:immunoglobulin light chain junction region [Macaca mulatta]MOW18049.1 immunoglobulin light chain junction region [Macaca mulatta]